jgi:hypothetical protein
MNILRLHILHFYGNIATVITPYQRMTVSPMSYRDQKYPDHGVNDGVNYGLRFRRNVELRITNTN